MAWQNASIYYLYNKNDLRNSNKKFSYFFVGRVYVGHSDVKNVFFIFEVSLFLSW